MAQNVTHPLDEIRVAAPCRADWNAMQGNDTTRYCSTCEKNVYNISMMSRAQAMELIKEKEGQLCVRFARRRDGTLITDNCPVGMKVARRPLQFLAAGFMALMAWGAMLFAGQSNRQSGPPSFATSNSSHDWRDVQPFKTLFGRTAPQPQITEPVMGAMAPDSLPASPAPAPPPQDTP